MTKPDPREPKDSQPELPESSAGDADEREPDVNELNGHWPFGGDKVTAGTAHYAPHDREQVRWFYEMSREQGVSYKEAAELISYDRSVLFKVCTGSYGGSLRNFVKAVVDYRKRWTQSQGDRRAHAFVEDSVARDMNRIFKNALKYNLMGLIIGPSGSGKSATSIEYARANNHGQTKYIRLPASAGVQLVMKEFAIACRISSKQPYEHLRKRVLESLDPSHLVIIDEGEQMFSTYQTGSRMKVIEVVREIYDRSGCDMVIIAAPSFEEELEEGKLKILTEKFGKRCVLRLTLPGLSKIPRRDLEAFAAAFGFGEIDDEHEDALRTLLDQSGKRLMVVGMRAALTLAENKNEKLGWAHFDAALRLLQAGRRIAK